MSLSMTKVAGLVSSCCLLVACHTTSNTLPSDHAYTYAAINPETLYEHRQNPNLVIIDARSPDAFNGWRLRNENKKGHIPDAQLFSAQWITRQIGDLDEAYNRLGLESQSDIVIYGYDENQATTVANWLVNQKGYSLQQIQILDQGFTGWTEDPIRPVNHLPGYHTIIPPQELQRLIEQEPALKIVEIGWDGEGKDYRQGHIPGAIYWDNSEFEHPPIYELNSVEWIRASLLNLGIDSNTPVVVYSTKSFGGARGAMVMKYAGVNNVTILNGGKNAWLSANLPIQTEWITPEPLSTGFGVSGPGDDQVVIEIDEARKLRQQKNGALVSIRSWREYTGEISGYEHFHKKGRIPGALWGRGKTDDHWGLDDYHNPDGTMRNYREIEELWNHWGIYPDAMELSFFCADGWGAAEVWWYAQAMGYENNTVWSSGSNLWLSEPENPVVFGEISRDQSIREWQEVSGS